MNVLADALGVLELKGGISVCRQTLDHFLLQSHPKKLGCFMFTYRLLQRILVIHENYFAKSTTRF